MIQLHCSFYLSSVDESTEALLREHIQIWNDHLDRPPGACTCMEAAGTNVQLQLVSQGPEVTKIVPAYTICIVVHAVRASILVDVMDLILIGVRIAPGSDGMQ